MAESVRGIRRGGGGERGNALRGIKNFEWGETSGLRHVLRRGRGMVQKEEGAATPGKKQRGAKKNRVSWVGKRSWEEGRRCANKRGKIRASGCRGACRRKMATVQSAPGMAIRERAESAGMGGLEERRARAAKGMKPKHRRFR